MAKLDTYLKAIDSLFERGHSHPITIFSGLCQHYAAQVFFGTHTKLTKNWLEQLSAAAADAKEEKTTDDPLIAIFGTLPENINPSGDLAMMLTAFLSYYPQYRPHCKLKNLKPLSYHEITLRTFNFEPLFSAVGYDVDKIAAYELGMLVAPYIPSAQRDSLLESTGEDNPQLAALLPFVSSSVRQKRLSSFLNDLFRQRDDTVTTCTMAMFYQIYSTPNMPHLITDESVKKWLNQKMQPRGIMYHSNGDIGTEAITAAILAKFVKAYPGQQKHFKEMVSNKLKTDFRMSSPSVTCINCLAALKAPLPKEFEIAFDNDTRDQCEALLTHYPQTSKLTVSKDFSFGSIPSSFFYQYERCIKRWVVTAEEKERENVIANQLAILFSSKEKQRDEKNCENLDDTLQQQNLAIRILAAYAAYANDSALTERILIELLAFSFSAKYDSNFFDIKPFFPKLIAISVNNNPPGNSCIGNVVIENLTTKAAKCFESAYELAQIIPLLKRPVPIKTIEVLQAAQLALPSNSFQLTPHVLHITAQINAAILHMVYNYPANLMPTAAYTLYRMAHNPNWRFTTPVIQVMRNHLDNAYAKAAQQEMHAALDQSLLPPLRGIVSDYMEQNQLQITKRK